MRSLNACSLSCWRLGKCLRTDLVVADTYVSAECKIDAEHPQHEIQSRALFIVRLNPIEILIHINPETGTAVSHLMTEKNEEEKYKRGSQTSKTWSSWSSHLQPSARYPEPSHCYITGKHLWCFGICFILGNVFITTGKTYGLFWLF